MGLIYLYDEKTGTYQLCSYCAPHLLLLFHITFDKKQVSYYMDKLAVGKVLVLL